MIHVKILFFATLRDKAGTGHLELDIEAGTSLDRLKALLVSRYPALQEHMQHCLAAIDHEYQRDDTLIPAGAEVALFPPVSGG